MPELTPTIESLKTKREHLRNDGLLSDDFTVRSRRAISWLDPAAQARRSNDLDVAFIFYWIAFEAAYANDVGWEPLKAEEAIDKYFQRLLPLDPNNTIGNAIGSKHSTPIATLVNNQYLSRPFWDYRNGKPGNDDWQQWFARDGGLVLHALEVGDTKTVLTILFRRLYTLRNQLVHGGATWKSEHNPDSVRPGARIMEILVPIFIDIMLDNATEPWGPPYYRPGLLGEQPGK